MTAPAPPAAATEATSWTAAHEAYLQLRLERLRLVIAGRVEWLRSHGWAADPMRDFQHLVVSDTQADRILQPPPPPDDHVGSARLAELDRRIGEQHHELEQRGGPPALALLSEIAGLTPFEEDVLFLALAPELDAGFARLYAYVQDDAALAYATPGLAAVLSSHWSDAGWESFLPDAPLSRMRLAVASTGDGSAPLAAQPLRLDSRLAAYLRGVNQPDERLQPFIAPLHPLPVGPEQQSIVAGVSKWLTDASQSGMGTGVNLVGGPGAGRRTVAAHLCSELGMALLDVDAPRLIASPLRDELVRLLGREALLLPAALYVAADHGGGEAAAVDEWRRLVDDLMGFVIVGSRDRRQVQRRLLTVALPDPDPVGNAGLWRDALGGDPGYDVAAVPQQFRFGPHGIHETVAEARARAELRGSAGALPTAEELWQACRIHAGHELGELAQRLDPGAEWGHLVLPDTAVAQLREIAAQVANRSKVYGDWGWDQRLTRGRGISALFAGPPGTGKTMAAEILAGELNLELYRIDLSQVVSKYIGETEKNLRRLFDAAERGGAILFFDEADALFGKRTEVKDSHDRYANIEINYLLQRMEDYRGLAILATNRKADLDDAFMRRIRFLVSFPFPDPASRLRIWQVMFPSGVPTSGLDYAALARLDIAGGNIKNVAVNASFLAADEGAPVRMEHLMRSAHREYHKIEKLVSRSDFGEHFRSDP